MLNAVVSNIVNDTVFDTVFDTVLSQCCNLQYVLPSMFHCRFVNDKFLLDYFVIYIRFIDVNLI